MKWVPHTLNTIEVGLTHTEMSSVCRTHLYYERMCVNIYSFVTLHVAVVHNSQVYVYLESYLFYSQYQIFLPYASFLRELFPLDI